MGRVVRYSQMATKPRSFDPNFYYHVYNCGVEKRQTFLNERDYQRFLGAVEYYLHDQGISYIQFQDLNEKAKKLYRQLNPEGLETLRVRVIAFCIMPNHFHFLIKPAKAGGLPRFVSDITNSYTKYFNIKNKRVGNLFQGTFKAKPITSEASLLQVSRYIHLNPENPDTYPYSSYHDWLGTGSSKIVDREELNRLLEIAGGPKVYQTFVDSKRDTDPALGIEEFTLEN